MVHVKRTPTGAPGRPVGVLLTSSRSGAAVSASVAGASNYRSSCLLGQDSVQTAEDEGLVSPNVSSVISSAAAGMVCPASGEVGSVSEGGMDSGGQQADERTPGVFRGLVDQDSGIEAFPAASPVFLGTG